MKKYEHDFYAKRHQKTIYSARTVLAIVLDILPPLHSAVDLGCGVGTWLSILKEKGISDIQGFDGPWVEQGILEIPKENFKAINFEEILVHERRYDLAISLEVAEHLSQEVSGNFVDSLIGASDFILFSAAIPFQGGKHHINEQWPGYWVKIFSDKGYVALDFVRKQIWNDKEIPFWYRQNILIFVKREKLSSLRLARLDESESHSPIAMVHPDLYLSKAKHPSIRKSFSLLLQAIKTWIKTRIFNGS